MPSTPVHAQIVFNNVNVAFAHTNLTDGVGEQLKRIEETSSRNNVYKMDLMMLGEGVLFSGGEVLRKKDLLTVSGILNYAQAITHRLMTPRGYHPADASFGVPWYDYLGKTYRNKLIVEGQLMVDVTDELLKDRRTQSVAGVHVAFEGISAIALTCSVIPVGYGRETLDVSLRAQQ